MKPNENISLFLPAGQVLTITAPSGSTGSVVRLPQMPGGGDSQSTTVINEADITFGPYANVERFKVFCTAGEVTPSMAVPAPSLMATDAEVAAAVAVIKLAEKTPVNAVASSGKLVSTGTAVEDGEQVTIGATVYTFKTTLSTDPAVPYEVLIEASATAQMTNLTAAIMATSGDGTAYGTGTVAHPTVTAAIADTDDIDLTAKTKGVAGNLIATTDDSEKLSWENADATLVDGIDGTVGVANETCADGTYIYHTPIANGISGNSWRRIELGTFY